MTHDAEEGNSWDMVSENEVWEVRNMESDGEDFVFVRQEDIMEGIASFMAAYLLSLKQAKARIFSFWLLFSQIFTIFI